MDAVTYPNESLIEFINEQVVPLRIPPDHAIAEDYMIRWTPSLLLLDKDGKEHRRDVGFFESEELIPLLMLAIGNLKFDQRQWAEAIANYEMLLAKYPKSDAAPEAVFQLGVAGYKSSNDPTPLRQAYERLTAEYEGDRWTKRAYPYRLIT